MKQINRLKVVLVEKNKSGKWLGEQLGKDPATISRWCNNHAQPSVETFIRMAEILEVDLRELFNSTRSIDKK
ncbi:MAG: helix-turn-helix transcriptional regulator [Odoribacter sp.]